MKTIKKIALLLFVISLIHNFTYSQWVAVTSGTSNFLNSVQIMSTTANYAAGFGGTFLKSSNSGATWITLTSPSASNINNIFFPATGTVSTGWAASVSGLYKTTNSGLNWVQQIASPVFADVIFPDVNNGIALTSSNNLRKTTNGGTNFTQIDFTSNSSIHGQKIAIANSSIFFVLGTDNVTDTTYIFKSANSGLNFTQVFKTPSIYFTISFINGTTGIICGQGGLMKKTTNGGTNWNAVTTGTVNDLQGLTFATTNIVYAVGGTGTILKSTDQGLNWVTQQSNTTQTLRSINVLANDADGIVVGGAGTIKRTTNGGVVTGFIQTSGEISHEYSLSQNYPNPFNPSTTINFNIPAAGSVSKGSGIVSLKVYDMLGKEIAILVNEELSAGSYSLSFDASSIPSGMYFYRISAGSFTETRKMILIK